MGQISLSLPSDGTTIEAADVNNPFNALLNEFNGNIDDNNIKSGANINGSKLLANSIPPTALDANNRASWLTGILPAPNTVTALGNRCYQLLFNTTDLTGYISAGQRLRSTRTAQAPNQCASLNGSNNSFSKSSPAGMTFTDDFVSMGWVKLTAYPGAAAYISSRYNGTSGFEFYLDSAGRVVLAGKNAAAANFSQVLSYQSVPLNKWVHIASQLDMSSFTATTTTSFIMLDGIDVPCAVSRGGTNPTALVQAGNFEIGSGNGGGGLLTGKLAQVAIFSAKVTEATILGYISQGLVGTETSLISAYSFSNSITDLNTTNANNLTNNNSTSITSADAPWGGQGDGTISQTLDYGIVTKTSFSTNTTLTVQVPEGCTIPTSGGVTSLAYSSGKAPYLFPAQRTKWQVVNLTLAAVAKSSAVAGTWQNTGDSSASFGQISIPVGEWQVTLLTDVFASSTTNGPVHWQASLSTSTSAVTNMELTHGLSIRATISTNIVANGSLSISAPLSISAQTTYYRILRTNDANNANMILSDAFDNTGAPSIITCELALL